MTCLYERYAIFTVRYLDYFHQGNHVKYHEK